MARFRTKSARQWVRGFDWDSSTFSGTIATGQIAFDWLRYPSDNFDPVASIDITPKTVVKTLVALQSQTAAAPAGSAWQAVFGIIAWDAFNPATFGGPDVPDPFNGAFDWMAWVSWGAVNNFSTARDYTTEFNANGGASGMLEYSSQRKLPPGRGVLYCLAFISSAANTLSFTGAARLGLKGDVTASGLGGN